VSQRQRVSQERQRVRERVCVTRHRERERERVRECVSRRERECVIHSFIQKERERKREPRGSTGNFHTVCAFVGYSRFAQEGRWLEIRTLRLNKVKK